MTVNINVKLPMKIQWIPEFSVHVEEIDNQHKRLFKFMRDFDDEINTQNLPTAIDHVLVQMLDYAKFHFKTEEKYFHEFNFPLTEAHESAHSDYVLRVNKFVEERKEVSKDNMIEFAYKILDFLEDWWVGHIQHDDKQYSKCFNEHGLK